MKESRFSNNGCPGFRVIVYCVFLFLFFSTVASLQALESLTLGSTSVSLKVGEVTKVVIKTTDFVAERNSISVSPAPETSLKANVIAGYENLGPLSYHYILITGKSATLLTPAIFTVTHTAPDTSATITVSVTNPGDGIPTVAGYLGGGGTGCAAFNPVSNTLHIPNVLLDGSTYWVDLSARRSNTPTLTFEMSGGYVNPPLPAVTADGGAFPAAARNPVIANYTTFDLINMTLTVPCIDDITGIDGTLDSDFKFRLYTQGNSVLFKYLDSTAPTL